MSIQDVKDRAHRVRPDLPTNPVIDALVRQYHGPGTVYSPAAIAEMVHGHPDAILATLLLLANEPMHIVSGHWVFCDDRGEQIPLNVDDVESALRFDEFYHPLSGNQIFYFKEAIGLVYESGERLEELLRSRSATAPRPQEK